MRCKTSLAKLRAIRVALGIVLAIALSPVQADEGQFERVVSVGGAVTEIIYALEQQHRVVGVDTTSLWPSEARDFPQVGYQRNLSAEGVLSLSPDLVLGTTDAGPPEVLEQIRSVGVEVTVIDNVPSVDGVANKIMTVGKVLGVSDQAARLVTEFRESMSAHSARMAELTYRPSVVFILSIGRGSPLAAGMETAASGIIELAGGRNAFSGYEGYKPVNAEALIAAQPEVILVTKRTLEMMGGRDKLLEVPGLAATKAGAATNIVAMDGLYLLGLGPRTPQAVQELSEYLSAGASIQLSSAH
ncbi:MAG: ABC transporter substrate-binding protein [Pseudomonadota bacterium]